MIGAIEAALATSVADEPTKASATALLQDGRALHEAGDHAASEAKLGAAGRDGAVMAGAGLVALFLDLRAV